jgi:prolyl oligopeptidase
MTPFPKLLLAPVVTAALAACAQTPSAPANSSAATPTSPMTYPQSRTVDQFDDYHGERVADPYRWLEDIDSADTLAWIEAQNRVTDAHLAEIDQRDAFRERLTSLWNYERFGVPSKVGEHYLYSYNDGLRNQPVVLIQKGLDGEPRTLLDPNTLSADGTVALSGVVPSKDGRHLAYGTSSGGSDWQEWRVLDIASGEPLADHIRWVKFSAATWDRDGSGFWYGRYDAPEGENALKAVNKFQKLYFHRLGTSQDQDTLVYERDDQPDWGFAPVLSDDGNTLLISVWRGTENKNLVFLKPVADPQAPVVELIDAFEYSYEFIGNVGNRYLFLTDDNAPRKRVIAIDIERPARDQWQEVIAESDATLAGVTRVGDRLVAQYLRDAAGQARLFGLDGTAVGEVALPGIGTVAGFERSTEGSETFFAFTSFTQPVTIHRLDVATGEATGFRAPKLPFEPANYETRQVFFTSKDGTRVPMFITARKGVELNGKNPTILYGYGGFDISLTPGYAPYAMAWLEEGGIYASVNLRGGGEYGRDWHQAGTKTNKQNVFDDMAAAGEFLIAQQYTSPAHMAIHGRSNGGLLAAAVAMQRPDLFAASVPGVGVLDMLRFREFTIGWAWESDYGTVKNPDEYRAIRAYSPLHNVREGVNYPAFLITTGDHDDRVFPAHSFKYAAALQAVNPERPALIRVDVRAGHGAGKPTAKQIAEWADILGFVAHHTGLETVAP